MWANIEDYLILRCHTNTSKAIFLINIHAYTVYRSHPKPTARIAEDALDIIIGHAERVICTEILVVVLAIIAVEPTEGTYPNISSPVFRDARYTTIGHFV